LIEKKTLLPPLRKALQFDGIDDYASVLSFAPGKENGYTCFFSIAMDKQTNWGLQTIIRLNDFGTGLYFNSSGGINYIHLGSFQPANRIELPNVDFTRIHHYTVIFLGNGYKIYFDGRYIGSSSAIFPDLTTNTSFIIGSFPGQSYSLSGLLAEFAFAKGIATPKQIIQMWNNSLLAQPRKEWRNLDWQLLLNFNHIIDNAGTYEIENLGSAGGNAVLSGYSSANIDPADPSYVLTDIDSLR
jgi:hypothetical protein